MRLSEAASGSWRAYVAIARPDHWFKNVFMLPGAALAAILTETPSSIYWLASLVAGVVATCLVASANYTLNEWLDAETDRHHPIKKDRPAVSGTLKPHLVLAQWLGLAAAGIGLGALINLEFALFSAALFVMGVLYNVPPFRLKDRRYLDVLSEAVNNPIRFMLGWFAIDNTVLPPSSILIAYWMGGAFLMAVKRLAEYRFIGDAERAASYRRSFAHYGETSLLASSFFYAVTSAFFLAVFLIKYRIEFLVAMPFLSTLFAWYLVIGLRDGSSAQTPERLYEEKWFLAAVVAVCVLIALLFVVDMPWLHFLLDHQLIAS
jgi:decaprenyl-phosphate phosphoribosyltransferase